MAKVWSNTYGQLSEPTIRILESKAVAKISLYDDFVHLANIEGIVYAAHGGFRGWGFLNIASGE